MTPGMIENTGQDAESPMQVEHFLLYGEERLPFRLVRRGTARGSIRIAVTPQGEIIVTADAATSLEAVEDVLQQRVRWLLETQERFQAQRAHALPRRFVGEETHFYLGRRHQLRIVDESEGKHVRLLRGRLVVPSRYPWSEEPAVLASRTEEIRRRLEVWYRQRAEEVLPQYFERMLPLVPWADRPPLRLVRMKARWGSCTPQGVVLLNPDLVRAPRHCIEYVILHELCHLREHRHSPFFWQLLAQVCPDWQARRAELDSMAEIWLGKEETGVLSVRGSV